MSRQRNVADLSLLFDVNRRDRAAAKADENVISVLIKADIVGIATEFDTPSRGVFWPMKQPHGTVACIGNIERIFGGNVGDTLRLGEPANRTDSFARGDIDDANAVVAKFGYEQPFMYDIDRHVIDAALNWA